MNPLSREQSLQRIGQRSRDIFTDTTHPSSFSSAQSILKAIRAEGGSNAKAKLGDVVRALSAVPAYSQHRAIQRRFPSMTTRSDDLDERWQVDLMNVKSFNPYENDMFQNLLIIIDVFSRRLAVVPLYDKKSSEVSNALELFFMTSGRIPRSITSDSGGEFAGRSFRDLCRKYGIKQYYTVSERSHASLVERVIRTLREKIGMLRTHTQSERYIDELGNLTDSYNLAEHSSLGMKPADAGGESIANRQLAAFHQKYRFNRISKKRRKALQRERSLRALVKTGDEVRIPIIMRDKSRFRKSHEPAFTTEKYTVGSVFLGDKKRPVIRLVTPNASSSNTLKSVYYPHEISLVTSQDV